MPFKSDKQRAYLWSQKPEVAKQIAYKKMGGPLSYYANGGDIADFDSWTDVAPEQQTHQAAIDAALDFTPVLGDIKAFQEAETPLDYGLATAGLVPGLGDLAPVGKGLLAATPLFARAKRAGTAASAPHKVTSINPKWNPKSPNAQAAAQSIFEDAIRVASGVAEDTPKKSRIAREFEGRRFSHGKERDPNDLIEYQVPEPDVWAREFGNLSRPDVATLQLAHKRGGQGGFDPFSAIPQKSGIHGGKHRPGVDQFKSSTSKKTAREALDDASVKSTPKAETISRADAEREIKKLQGLEKFGIATEADLKRLASLQGQLGLYMGGRVGPLGGR